MKFILFVFLCLLQSSIFAQKKGQELIDSVLEKLPTLRQDTLIVKALNEVGTNYLYFNPKLGIPYVDSGIAVAEKMQWKKGTARMLNLKGLLVGDTGNNTQARVYFQKSFVIQNEIKNTFGMITALNNIGRAYQRESDFSKALQNFFKALSLAEESKNNEQISLVATNLTSSFLTQGNYEKGLEYAEMTIKYGELANAQNNIGKGYIFIGQIKAKLKDTIAAKANFEKALAVFESIGNQTGVAQALSTLGPLEYPDYKKAIEIMLRAQKIFNEIGASFISSIGNLNNLGVAYLDLARKSAAGEKKVLLDKSESYLQQSLEVCKEAGNIENQATINSMLAELEEEKGNYKSALNHFRNFYQINDSLFSQDKKNELAGLENKHNLDIKNKEIAISKLELFNQRRTQIGLIIGLALLGVIGGLLFWQNRMRKKSNTTLMVLNNQLDEANKVKAKFFGILSHDLRSPISSLINFLYLLKNEPELLSANERTNYQQQIGQSTEELLQTMETMLIWSKEQMDNFKPDIRIVQVRDLFDYLQKFFSQTTQVQISFSDPEFLEVSADENYLKVIMQNLTSNAIKALKNNPNGTIAWKTRKDGLKTIISITDNGPGINAEQIKVLYHEENGVNAKTGFGLHLIRDLAKAIQYHISIESKPGMGTTFVLSS